MPSACIITVCSGLVHCSQPEQEVICADHACVLCRQAADEALNSVAVAFAREHRHTGALMIASNDQGFAGLLRYTRDLGCLNISVGAIRSLNGSGSQCWTWLTVPAFLHLCTRRSWSIPLGTSHLNAVVPQLIVSSAHVDIRHLEVLQRQTAQLTGATQGHIRSTDGRLSGRCDGRSSLCRRRPMRCWSGPSSQLLIRQ